ncbi:MAG TPA: PspC domain-containing protein [Candidatus Binatia bacterium]|nr:PspC domain-containing protein [Candidatus Binatia bacterium]
MNRRLYRSRTDKIVGGAAAGLADYMNTDPALVRIAWAILVPLTGGVALLAYIAALIVVPEAPRAAARPPAAASEPVPEAGPAAESEAETEPEPKFGAGLPDRDWSDGRAGILVGIGLVLIGLWFLLREYLPGINWGLIWPLIIVGIGAVILFGSLRRRN